jgi:hypothetical protein
MQGESEWQQRGRCERVLGLYSLGVVSIQGALHRRRLGGLGGVLGMASWTESSGVGAELDRVLCQRVQAWVQFTCTKFVTPPGRVSVRACKARVAWRRGFDALQARARLGRKACVHKREHSARSRRPWCVRGAVKARARGWPTGGAVGCCRLGDGGGVSGSALARQQLLACCRSLGLQRACSGGHRQEGEGVVR